MRNILFSSGDKKINISETKNYKKLLNEIFVQENVVMKEIRIIFCSDEYLLKINKSYLKQNYYTDVISFVLSEINEPVLGEIYLSVERIKENAKSYSVLYQNELLRVMIHGCLHLCGYTDNSLNKKKHMHKKENYFLAIYSKFSRET